MKSRVLSIVSLFCLICITNSSVYANTKFNVERK